MLASGTLLCVTREVPNCSSVKVLAPARSGVECGVPEQSPSASNDDDDVGLMQGMWSECVRIRLRPSGDAAANVRAHWCEAFP